MNELACNRIDRVYEESPMFVIVDIPETINPYKIKEMKADALLRLENAGITDEWYEED